MNETSSDKKQIAKAESAGPQPTRVPVKWLYFFPDNQLDLPFGSGYSQMSNLSTVPAQEARPHCTCNWIPAWGFFEIIYHPGGDRTPQVEMISRDCVRRWTP